MANAFSASGKIDSKRMARFASRLGNRGIDVGFIAYGDGLAGFVQAANGTPMQAVRRSKSDKLPPCHDWMSKHLVEH